MVHLKEVQMSTITFGVFCSNVHCPNRFWVLPFQFHYILYAYLCYLLSDSQPFQEFEKGATGRELGDGAGLNALRLDDDNEFPPMTHKVD